MYLRIITTSLLILLVAFCTKKEAEKEKPKIEMVPMPAMNDTTPGNLVYYTCPMPDHKAVHSATPGKCDQCGMDLVKVVVATKDNEEFYGCPMPEHSFVRQDSAGVCPECGMQLEPMRMVRNDP